MPAPALDGLGFGLACRSTIQCLKVEAKQKSNGRSQSMIFCSSLLRDKVEGFASDVLEEVRLSQWRALVNSVEWAVLSSTDESIPHSRDDPYNRSRQIARMP